MKKLNVAVMVVLMIVAGFCGAWTWTNSAPAMPNGPTWTGAMLGTGVKIDNDLVQVIGIGCDGGLCWVRANYAAQIGTGSNVTANTIKYRDKYLVTTTSSTPDISNCIQSGSTTNNGVVTFPVAFSGVPHVVCSWAVATTHLLNTKSITENGFVAEANTAGTNPVQWIATYP